MSSNLITRYSYDEVFVHFQNESFEVDLESQGKCLLEAKVTISAVQTKKAHAQAIKTVNKEISVPGFRKGKAPDSTVMTRFGNHVEREWKEILLNEAIRQTFSLSKKYPLTKSSIKTAKVEKCDLQEGAIVSFVYESTPDIPTIDFSCLNLPNIEKTPVDSSKYEQILQEIRESHADWKSIESRPIEKGDYVDLTIESIDQDPPKAIFKDRRFGVKKEQMADWMMTLVLGKSAGDVVEGESRIDDDAENSVKEKFRPSKMRITIHSVHEIILPAVDDALAQKVGAQNVEELKAKIMENLKRDASEEQKRKQIEALEKTLIEAYHFEIPASMLEEETSNRLNKKLSTLPDSEKGLKEQTLKTEAEKEAEEALRLYFLMKQITLQGNVSVSNQEITEEISKQPLLQSMLFGKDADREKSRDLIYRFTTMLIQKKAKDYALNQVLLLQGK